MNTKKKKQIWKFPIFIRNIFFLCIFLLYIKLLYLTLSPTIYGKNMKEFAASRNTVRRTIQASRGSIFDNNGKSLAINVSSYTLIAYLDPKRSEGFAKVNHVKDIEETATKLADTLDADKDYILKILKNGQEKNRYQVEFGSVGRGITELKKDEILSLNLPGIAFMESEKRYYPNGNFASYILGYAKDSEVKENDEIKIEIQGEMGIERTYDEALKGEDGYNEYQQDRYGYKIAGTKEIKKDAKEGNDIYLTIDSNIQRFIETEIEQLSKYKPEWAILMAMDAKTGAILGASSTPSFDPNVREVKSYENPFATTIYEPGSTMKIYTYLCAIEEGKYDGNKTYSSGSIKIGKDTISDWNNTGWGTLTLDKGFEYSSNVGAVNVVKKYLDKNKLKDCLKTYGFGSKTGIEMVLKNKEASGKLNFNYEVEVATASFGQGIDTTAIQHLQAATIIASGGYKISPYLIEKVVDKNTKKTIYEHKIQKSEQLVKRSSIEKIKELMYNTVHGTDSGTAAKSYNIEGFDLIGKTGTAQIYENGKGYLKGDNNYIFSVVMMFPKDDPEVIIYAAMKKPNYGKYSGLAKSVKSLIKNIVKYKNLYQEEQESKNIKTLTLSSYIGKEKEEVKKQLENYNLDITIIGQGDQITNQYPKKGTRRIEKDKVILITNGKKEMPNIKGWSKSEVVAFASMLDLKLEIEGSGYVSEYEIENKPLEKNMSLKVTLESKNKE